MNRTFVYIHTGAPARIRFRANKTILRERGRAFIIFSSPVKLNFYRYLNLLRDVRRFYDVHIICTRPAFSTF